MSRPPEPLFFERQTYRRRRLGDAARLLPVFGVAFFLLPILWGEAARTASGLVFLFTVWAGLIAVMAVMAPALSESERAAEDTPPTPDVKEPGDG